MPLCVFSESALVSIDKNAALPDLANDLTLGWFSLTRLQYTHMLQRPLDAGDQFSQPAKENQSPLQRPNLLGCDKGEGGGDQRRNVRHTPKPLPKSIER